MNGRLAFALGFLWGSIYGSLAFAHLSEWLG